MGEEGCWASENRSLLLSSPGTQRTHLGKVDKVLLPLARSRTCKPETETWIMHKAWIWGLSRTSALPHQVKSHRSVIYVLRKRAELQTTRKNLMKLPTQWASLVARWKRICLQCRRPGFDPWVGKIPWRRKWQPTPIFLPGKSHGQRSLAGYSPWGHKELDMSEWLNHHHPHNKDHNTSWRPPSFQVTESVHCVRNTQEAQFFPN